MLSNADTSRIKNQLAHFDCNDREADIYLEALLLGPSSIQDLSRNLKMNRVTVHSATEQLIHKGLLFESRKGKKRLIVAAEPKTLAGILQRKKNELQLVGENLDYTIELLSNMQKTDESKHSVKFYEGVDGFKRMLEEAMEAKDELLVFNSGQYLADQVDPVYLEDYIKRRAKKGISARLIFPPIEFAKILQKDGYISEVRFLKPDKNWTAGYFMWNDKIAFLSFREGKQTCTILENKDLAYFFRNIVFEQAWKEAKPAILT